MRVGRSEEGVSGEGVSGEMRREGLCTNADMCFVDASQQKERKVMDEG